jgi:predicted SprT family Zn-dependent metalloprotease
VIHKSAPITPAIYGQLQDVFDRFNKQFWGGKLPSVVLTFVRHPKSMGYFAESRWVKDGKKKGDAHEIALNPDYMRSGGTKTALATLLHEMCHLWQRELGKKCPKRFYHNKEFAIEMERVGLITSSTGVPGGKRTGVKMSDYIAKGGPFDKLATLMVAKERFGFEWVGVPVTEDKKPSKKGKRVKYQCENEECDDQQTAWAKHGASLICGGCEEAMVGQTTGDEGDND